MEKKEIKKLLAGVTVASLLAGGIFMLNGCSTTSLTQKPDKTVAVEGMTTKERPEAVKGDPLQNVYCS